MHDVGHLGILLKYRLWFRLLSRSQGATFPASPLVTPVLLIQGPQSERQDPKKDLVPWKMNTVASHCPHLSWMWAACVFFSLKWEKQ